MKQIQPERYFGQEYMEIGACFLFLFIVLVLFTIANMPQAPPAPELPANVSQPVVYTETPTPEPTLTEEQFLEMNGGIPMGEFLSWQRENVSGLKDMSVHTRVYDYRIFPVIHWYSTSWGQYFLAGAGEDRKFLFVFVETYADEQMARSWGIDAGNFWVQIGDQIYSPTKELLPEIRINEFDEIWDAQHRENIKPYGYLRTQDIRGYESAEELGFLKAGRSNSWDGYIPFIIPANTQPKDIRVLGEFGSLASPHWWQLK